MQKEFDGLEHCALKLMLTKENAVYSLRANHYTPKNYEKGFTMDVSKVKRNETSHLVYHKTMNYGTVSWKNEMLQQQEWMNGCF